MAYSNGNPVLVANPTPVAVSVGGVTVNPNKAALVTPNDAVAITLGAGLTGGTPTTSLTVAALPQAIQAGTVIDISQTISGVAYKQQAVVSASAAAAATTLSINSFTPAASYTVAATLLSSSQGVVAGFVEAGCCVSAASSASTSVLDSPTTLVEKGSRLLYGMARAVESAGTDTFGVKGL